MATYPILTCDHHSVAQKFDFIVKLKFELVLSKFKFCFTADKENGLWSDDYTLEDHYLLATTQYKYKDPVCTGCTCDNGLKIIESCAGPDV